MRRSFSIATCFETRIQRERKCAAHCANIKIFALRDFAKTHHFLCRSSIEADMGDNFPNLERKFFIANIQLGHRYFSLADHALGTRSTCNMHFTAGDQKKWQRIANGRSVGDVANERCHVLDLRRRKEIQESRKLWCDIFADSSHFGKRDTRSKCHSTARQFCFVKFGDQVKA